MFDKICGPTDFEASGIARLHGQQVVDDKGDQWVFENIPVLEGSR